MKKIVGIILGLLLLSTALPALAAGTASTTAAAAAAAAAIKSDRCGGQYVSDSEAGVMGGVCTICWEQGDCSLSDILQVFVNISDYILGIVGSLALLLFVVGGFYLLVSQGESGRVQKGKAYIVGAIVGLIIVFVAYIGVQTIESTIVRGTLSGTSAEYIGCTIDSEDGDSCDINSVCENNICTTICNYQEGGICNPASTHSLAPNCSSGTSLCPGGEDEVCCTEVYIGDAPEEIEFE